MPLQGNFPTIVELHKKAHKRNISLQTPRTLLTKVIEDKIQRNSSTYIFNEQSSTSHKVAKENMASQAIDINRDSSDEEIDADNLLIGKDGEEVIKSIRKVRPSKRLPTKREFKFSSISKRPLQSSSDVKEKHVSKSRTVASKGSKITEKHSSKEVPSKSKSLEYYYPPVTRKKMPIVHDANVKNASKLRNIHSQNPETPELRESNRHSLMLRERNGQSNFTNVNKKKSFTLLSSAPPKVLDLVSDLSASSSFEVMSDEGIRPLQSKGKQQKQRSNKISQMIDDNSIPSTSHAGKFHSTAMDINAQTLGLDVSSIEPVGCSSSMLAKNIQQHSIHDTVCPTPVGELTDPDSANSDVPVDQLLMEVFNPASKRRKLPNTPRVPDDITRHIAQRFSKMPIANSSTYMLNVICDDFWKQTLETLHTYTNHGQRLVPNVADVELLLYRQGHARNRNEMNSLIERYLPLDLASKIVVSAAAGNELQNA